MQQGFALTDKVVVVTGAAGGLGREFALGFAAEGAKLVVADRDYQGVLATAEQLTNMGSQAIALEVDVTNQESVAALAKSALDRFGAVDVLVNNAAIYATIKRSAFTEIDPDEWDRVMSVNVKGTWLCSAALLPLMRAGGSIINLASATVFSGSPQWMHYVASKSAVIGMTRVMAKEAGDREVRVNAIAPGFTLTDASLGLMENAASYGVERGSLKRASQPQDIVGAALFLASEKSGFITGQTLVVDGGKQFI